MKIIIFSLSPTRHLLELTAYVSYTAGV